MRTTVAVLLALLAGCGGGSPRPAAIVLNEDACAYCRMAVSQRQFAAELVTTGGTAEVFDDIGCLAAWLQENGRPPGSAVFVVDFTDGGWLPAEGASYVRAPDLPTPMGYGLAAFADRAAAQAAVAHLGGEVVTWDEVLAEERR
jgi:copper chaperone NosL